MAKSSTAERRIRSGGALTLLVAISCCGAGLFLAWHHPLWPAALTAAFAVWVAVSTRWPGLWLFIVPAAMPVLNFSPWTGWLIFDEFDLLILASLAGGFGARTLGSTNPRPLASGFRSSASPAWNAAVPVLLSGLAFLGLSRGVADGGLSFAWAAGYADASNTLRLSKSLIYVTALWPLLRIELERSTPIAIHRLARGMQTGLMLVGLAVLWERIAYPGLLDFSARYRTTAAFWEMHVGGAAIDVYLALATPFAVWALLSAKSHLGWAAAAALTLVTGHACLTTFSRGAYTGIAGPLVLLGAAWWFRRHGSEPHGRTLLAASYLVFAGASAAILTLAFVVFGYAGIAFALLSLLALVAALWLRRSIHGRRAAALALALALVTEVVAVIGGGTFMRSRLDASEADFGARLAHWRRGVGLLASPSDWLLGIGAGRLPARYSREVPRGEFSGAVALIAASPGRHAVQLSGPATVADYAGLFSLTQRIGLRRGGAYQVGMQVRAAKATTIALDVCEQHLLYPRHCQGALVRVAPSRGDWQSITVPLEGPELDPGHWYAPRLGLFSASIRNTGTSAELASLTLTAPDGTQLLANRDFSAGLTHWFPAAESHFLPWHIDNFYLELLIEHGALGLVAFVLLIGLAFSSLYSLWRREVRIAPFLAASLFGTLLVGCVSSVLDVPRISFLFLLIVIFSLQLREQTSPAS